MLRPCKHELSPQCELMLLCCGVRLDPGSSATVESTLPAVSGDLLSESGQYMSWQPSFQWEQVLDKVQPYGSGQHSGCRMRVTHVKNGGKLQIPGLSKPVELVVGLSFLPRALGSVPASLVPTDVDMPVCCLLVVWRV